MATTHDFEGLWSEAVDRYIDSTSRTLSEQGLLKQLKSSKELEEQLVKDHLSFTSFRAKRSKITGRIKKAVKPFTVISAVASSAISLSPFAPASTIFGAVVFVIQAADGVSEAYDWIDELFNKLGDFTVRLEEYCKESMSPRLEKKVVQILGCLLDILARSEKTIKTGRWKKYAAALFLGADEVTKASFDRLAKLFEDEQRLISAITFATNQRMDKRIEEIDQAVRQTHRAATNAEIGVDAIQQSQRRDTILNWISSADFPSQQSDAINKRQEGTGQWFLDASEFNSWIRGSKQTLFCHGMPGAGKTIVAAMAINHLFRTIQSSANGVVYIYCDYKMRGEQNVPSLFAAILRQLVQAQQLIPDDVLRLHEDHSRERTTLSYDEIFATLRSTLKNYSTVHLVIDALDELLGRQDGTLSQLLAKIRDLQKDANLNLMITSRFIPELKEEFEHATKLEVRASNGDVRKFVADQIYQLPKCIRGDEELPSVVEDNIVKAADGMFLLACLSVDLLRDTTTKKQAKSTLERISKNFQGSKRRLAQVYDELYCKTIKRIGTQPSMKRALARNVLSWITYAERPLTVEELRHAVAVEFGDKYLDEDNMPDVEEITTVCAGLVVVNEANNIIRFVHYTTQEYFERIREKWNRGIKVKIASSCLTYLSFNAFRSGSCGSYEEFQNRLEQYKLLDYASRYWGQHARQQSGFLRYTDRDKSTIGSHTL
ncbi:ankyrin repeat-containing protein [Penicillium canescens]|uniref:Ankyrin repeat-containing protein n=1 Tax=Penicillium canescens TaxID=5083 RepID=A0AAD6NE06_PENCN|nr:ankyrin repeat-containing protein [Penicillium canescens]